MDHPRQPAPSKGTGRNDQVKELVGQAKTETGELKEPDVLGLYGCMLVCMVTWCVAFYCFGMFKGMSCSLMARAFGAT